MQSSSPDAHAYFGACHLARARLVGLQMMRADQFEIDTHKFEACHPRLKGDAQGAHKPEKSGVTVVPWLGFCANAADENSAAVVAMINFLMIDFFR